MSYSSYYPDSYIKYFQKKDCRPVDRYGRTDYYNSPTYSSNGAWYYGPWSWFPRTATTVLEWFLEPTNQEDHQALYEEITTGDDMHGFLAYGQKQEGLMKFYVLLYIISVMGILVFCRGVWWTFFEKKNATPSHDKKRRAKLVPLFLCHIPLFAVLGLLLTIFTMNLWSLYADMRSDYDRIDKAVRGANIDLPKMVMHGNCEYEASVIDGIAAIDKAKEEFFITQIEGCAANESMNEYMNNLKTDKDLLLNLKESAQSISAQMNELQEIIKNDEQQKGISEMSKLLIKLRDELGGAYESFDAEIDKAKKIRENRNSDIEVLHKKLKEISQPLTGSLKEIQTRLRTVIDTFHGAVTEETKWIDVVGLRMSKMKAHMKQKGDPLSVFIATQLIVSLPVISAMFVLVVAFLVLAVRIVFPQALSKFPKGALKTQEIITFSFNTQWISIACMAIMTWFCLNLAASLNATCKPMYSTEYYNEPMNKFYKDVLGNFVFKDFEGNEINQTFADSVTLARNGDSITTLKFGKLVPKLSERVDFDGWFKEVAKTFKENPVKDIEIEDRNKILKQLPYIIAEFKDQNRALLARGSPSQLARIVAKQLDDLERQLNSLSLKSLNAAKITGCSGTTLNSDITRTLQSIFHYSIEGYETDFDKMYTAAFIYNSYMGVGRQMCVDWRTPLSGLWLAGTLLSITLLASSLVFFYVAKNLYRVGGEDSEKISDTATMNTTIYAPLIDGDMNPEVKDS